jgi:hypothetical protein
MPRYRRALESWRQIKEQDDHGYRRSVNDAAKALERTDLAESRALQAEADLGPAGRAAAGKGRRG